MRRFFPEASLPLLLCATFGASNMAKKSGKIRTLGVFLLPPGWGLSRKCENKTDVHPQGGVPVK